MSRQNRPTDNLSTVNLKAGALGREKNKLLKETVRFIDFNWLQILFGLFLLTAFAGLVFLEKLGDIKQTRLLLFFQIFFLGFGFHAIFTTRRKILRFNRISQTLIFEKYNYLFGNFAYQFRINYKHINSTEIVRCIVGPKDFLDISYSIKINMSQISQRVGNRRGVFLKATIQLYWILQKQKFHKSQTDVFTSQVSNNWFY